MKPSIIINNTPVCVRGGMLWITGDYYTDKSPVIEEIIRSVLGQETDVFHCTDLHPNTVFISKSMRIKPLKGMHDRLSKEFNTDVFNNLTIYYWNQTRIEKVREWTDEVLKNKNIELLIIDGLDYMVSDVNDEKECSELINKLFASLDEYMTLIVTTHDKTNDSHLGQILQRKCDSLIEIKGETRPQKISCILNRDAPEFEPIQY